ncbi:MAG: amino acid adenylation domain-containing protein [Bacteroidota bacterium]
MTELFKEQVQLSPDQSAVVFGEQSWTYQQLDQASDELAVHLQKELAVQPGDFVGLLVERSPWMVLGILGTIKAGAAYVPISIDHPQERKQFILQDTDIQVVLTTSFAQEQSEALEVSTWVMDRQITSTSTTDPVLLPTVTPQAPAYVIYTSGTTGQPKGTLVSHQNLINLVKAHETLAFQNTDRIVQWPSYTFDVSAFDFFNTLLNGASLYLISEKVYNDPALLSSFIKEQQISAISFATAFFNAVVDHDVNAFKNMRRIMIGGEKASLSHTQRAAKVAGPNVIINAYGPTEATVITSYFPVVTPDFHQLPIGRPISNVKMYIVDQFEQLAGIGVAGELWIGGDAVSLGYHDRPELNAQKFVADPFSDDPAARIYKTGDLARYLPDGNIDFIGRMDAQVKIRGYRVELGEIEHLLQAHPYVRQAVVLTKKDLSQNNQIIAYIVEEQEFDQAAIQTFLQQLLPAYMLPAAYVLIDEVPLTLNGKVNQNLLPPPDFMSLKQQAYLAPRNELEQQIVDIWLGLLKVEQIGVNDDFFELGGHSLLATRAIAQLKSLKAIELNVRDLFQFPTTTQLAHFIEGQQELQQIPGLVPQERATHIPLSFAQERLWFVHNLGGSQQYHTPTILTLRGDVDAQLLMQAFKAVVQRHEVLRTLIKEQNGKASQIITSGEDWSVELIEKAPFQNTTEQQAYLEAFTFKAFDFGQDYPIRVQLIQTGEEQYLLAMVVHHIASDGWSASILIDEVWSIYQSLKAESEINLPVLDVQYADYAIWQRKHHDEEAIQKQLNYWKGQLREVTPLELPTDLPRPAIQSIRGGTLATQLNKEVTQQLLSLAQSQQVTPFMLIMAACKVLLYRYSNQQDICIGTPVAGRTTKASEQLIGCFINTLAIRSKVEADMTFEQLLQNVKQTTLDAFANQLVPFEQIVEVLGAARDMSRSPIHQVSLSYQNVPDAQEVPEASIQMDDSLAAELPITTQRDLSIFAKELPDGLVLAINYCIDLFTEQSIEQMLKHLHLILQSVLESPQTPVAQLAMIDQGEKTLLLQEFNPTAVAYPSDQNIIHLFEQQVEQSPEQIALIFADQQWSYQALNQQANHLAQYLRQQYQVGQGDFVAMLLPRSEWAIVATLAILKTGATYVPIDLKYPQERKQHILEDTQAKVVLTLSSQLAEVMDLDATLCSVDIEIDNFEQENSPANPNFAQKGGQHLAYAMYTSGSMGQPKGVLIPHRAIARLIFNPDFAFLGPSTRIYQYAPLAFDAATFEIWGTLLKGGTLIVPEDGLKTVEAIAQDLQQHQVNTLWLTAGLFHQVVDYHLPLFEGLEYLLSGGDSLHIPAIQKVRTAYPELVFINGYGPTESTTFATIHRLNAGENPDPNLNLIGRPIGNTQVFILNPDSDILTPRGISGELCIGGDGLADAYLNLPELTQAKFIEHPFREGQRLYRTGDLGKFLADGNIVFMGRVDDQVKVRGYRIELGEIENALQATEQVKQATVVTQNDSTGNKQVVAYIVPQANFDATAIRSALKHQLPEYMIPTFMVEMDALPLTNNGKVDRAALPVPDISSLSEVDFVAPRNETEAAIAQIWQDLLEVEQVGIHHDFFTLGGHSLLATRVISEIREQFQVEIAIREIFEFTTVEQLAQLIDQKEQQHSLPKLVAQERPERIPLSYAQERLWFIDRLQGSTQYNIPILLKISGEVRFDIFQQSFNALLQRHELLRTVLKEDDGQLYQSIQSAEQWQMELIEEEQYFDQQNLADLVNQLVFSPFQLSEEFPIRVHLIKMNETGDFLFIINLHHIATDGWSNSILVDELIQHYRAFEKGQVPDFAPLKVQYADYAIWQKTHFDKAVIGQQMEYWTTQLADVVPLNLLTDFPRPAMRSIRGGQRSILLDAKLSEKILQIANEKEATPFMFFLTALNTLLFRYTGQQDFCVGSPIAGRTVKEVESMIGFFINNLVLRAQLAKDMSFDDLFEQVKNTTLDAYANQMVSFEQIVEALGVQRDLTQDPLYQVTLSYQNMPENKERGFDNITFDENYQLEELEILAQRDLSVFVLETPEGYALSINYCIDLFKDETIEGMLLHFNQLLVSIVERSDLAIGQLEMIHAEEQRLLIEQYNQTEADYPKTQSIAQLFAAQAAIHPDKVALVFGDQQWTYQEIDERANQLAKYLIEKHEVQKGDFVGILMNRSEWMILSMLATLKAGAAYVPIDPTYPSERKAFMIEDTEVKALLILSEQLFEVSTLEVPTIALDIQTDQLEAFDGVKPVKVEGSIEDNAYVMYTSGTTGQPKGILVNQRNVIKLAFEQKAIAINADDKVLQWSNFAFDGSTYEIYASLLNGASLHLIPNKDAADAVLLARHIRQHELTVAFITTETAEI